MARSREAWRRLIVAFGKSKDSVDAFCAREAINARTFRWWRWKLGVAMPVGKTPRPGAIQIVEVAPAPAPLAGRPGQIEIVIEGHGLTLRMSEGANAMYVAELAAELRARC